MRHRGAQPRRRSARRSAPAAKEKERQMRGEARLSDLQQCKSKKEAADAEREARRQQRSVRKDFSPACAFKP